MTSQNGDLLCGGVMLTAVVFHRFSDYLNRGTPPPFSAEAEQEIESLLAHLRPPKHKMRVNAHCFFSPPSSAIDGLKQKVGKDCCFRSRPDRVSDASHSRATRKAVTGRRGFHSRYTSYRGLTLRESKVRPAVSCMRAA